jgi:hypothetical protein
VAKLATISDDHLQATSGQLDQKLIVTMMVTVLRQELLPKLDRGENLDHDGPSFFSRNFGSS